VCGVCLRVRILIHFASRFASPQLNSRGNGIHSETKKASRKVTNNDWYHWKAQGPYFTLVLFKVVEFMDLMVKMASA